MGLLATDFEDSFGSNQMGAQCPEAYFEWIQYVIEHCPVEIYTEITNEILRAFFNADVLLFPQMFASAVAGIIYRRGHLLSLMHTECFIERKLINLRKEPDNFMKPDQWLTKPQKWFLHVELGTEEICRLTIATDPLPDADINERIGIRNPYYQG